ncbi:hypothetical protein [Amycolatopsis nigrescens]|uniref:hypothetical protein n=1 Tax=Amycolatopsis nigrescens TaxID=381445 RepID=UPI00038088E3|nr:hypothetical protein [Amycolatopsis nigrescens]
MKLWGVPAVLVLGVLLTGCTEVNEAMDQANTATNKVSACGEALGLADLNPAGIDPEKLQAEAQQKADRLRELGDQVAEADVKQTLFTMADSYVALEKKQADELGNLTDWMRRNAANLDRLRQVCL